MSSAKSIRGAPTIAVAYLRVSTEEQHLGPEAQRHAIQSWAGHGGVDVVSWHEDHGISGASPLAARPGLTAAIAALRPAGAGVLAVAKRDRLARDALLAATVDHLVRREGATVAAADGVGNGDAPADQFMRTILDGAAAFELAQIRSRTKAALAVKAARQERVGTIPWGYRVAEDGRALVEDPEEAAVVQRAKDLRASGASLDEIADQLAAAGACSRRGQRFHRSAILRMLRRASQ